MIEAIPQWSAIVGGDGQWRTQLRESTVGGNSYRWTILFVFCSSNSYRGYFLDISWLRQARLNACHTGAARGLLPPAASFAAGTDGVARKGHVTRRRQRDMGLTPSNAHVCRKKRNS